MSLNKGQFSIVYLLTDLSFVILKAGSSTTVTHKPCSTIDDASQIPQFFEVQELDQGPSVYYLGGTMSQTGNSNGYIYSGEGDTSGQAYILSTDEEATNPEDAGYSFFLISDS